MRWSYKTEHYKLKKEGLLGSAFLDESEIELSLNEYGRAGWELVSILETMDGVIAVFKQPLSRDSSPLLHVPADIGEQEQHVQKTDDPTTEHFIEEERGVEEIVRAPVLEDLEVVDAEAGEDDSLEKKDSEPGGDIGSIRIE